MSFLFKSKLFLPVSIAVVAIMLLSIVYALVPKDSTSSVVDGEQSSQEEQLDGTAVPSDYEALITDETTNSDDSASDGSAQPAPNDDEAETEGYTRTTVGTTPSRGGRGAVDDGSSNIWLNPCPSDSVLPPGGLGACQCPANQVGTPGNCHAPDSSTPGPTGATLTKTTTISPARKFKPVGNITAKTIPDGAVSGAVLATSTVLDIVALKEYSDGSKFYLTQVQLNEGSKVGYEASTLKTLTTPPPATDTRNPAAVKKVIVLIFENKTYKNASKNMPKLMSIINQGKHAYYSASFSAGEADSYSEYVALGGGNAYGFPPNSSAKANKYNTRSIFGLAIQNGKSAKVYLEDKSLKKHDPWLSFGGGPEKTYKASNIQGLANLTADINAGSLPTISMLVPNSKNSSHDEKEGKPTLADAFAQKWIQTIMAGPDWKSGQLAIITTYDEANTRSNHVPGQIFTTILHPYLATKGKATAVSTRVDHYSLVRFYAEVAGVWVDNPRVNVKLLGNAKYPEKVSTASSMTSQLGLVPSP